MKLIKKIILLISVLLFSLSLPLCAFAETDIYGTYDRGMQLRAWEIYAAEPTNEFMNSDFEEGLRYWATVSGERPCDVVKLVDEGDNTFIEFTGTGEWSGLMSPRFYFEDAQAGQQLVVIYDWRGSDNFQVYLSQLHQEDGEIRLGLKGGKVLYEAKNDTEWNTSITRTSNLVAASNTGNENFYLAVGVQVATDPNVFAQVDNLRIGIMNMKSGKVYDFDGNLICPEAYEDTENDFEDALAGYSKEQAEELEQQRRPNMTKPESDKTEDKEDKTEGKEEKSEEKGNVNKEIITATVVAGIVVLLAVAVVVVVAIIIKKPKNKT